ncbi:DUF3305 domain-containing protein [Halovulum dunhuangense]|uniref:DUF3305 domain-containing protein n=2 Tax=Halovulum dunhuangense TaxID=1505036 RepID=A0A849L283_9RHOB|nr:DUF3305 domain-containing protein [Halovulum dunhuangense]
MPVGVVIRRTPGVTRWAKYAWKGVSALPGAPDEVWRELRSDGEVVDIHVGTRPLELWRSEAEAYLAALSSEVPSIFAVLRKVPGAPADRPFDLLLVTASPYEAQDYTEGGDEIVEQIPMPDAVRAWIGAFVEAHYEEETFVKRRRDKRAERHEDGRGDPRIQQPGDVYRSPGALRRRME